MTYTEKVAPEYLVNNCQLEPFQQNYLKFFCAQAHFIPSSYTLPKIEYDFHYINHDIANEFAKFGVCVNINGNDLISTSSNNNLQSLNASESNVSHVNNHKYFKKKYFSKHKNSYARTMRNFGPPRMMHFCDKMKKRDQSSLLRTPVGISGKDINPLEPQLNSDQAARFFVVKSYSEVDVYRSIKYGIWCSTEHGNKRLDTAYKASQESGAPVFLFFSVNGSGYFCGVSQMTSSVDYTTSARVWSDNKWHGKFQVKWLYIKDIPNYSLRHIEASDNRCITASRDAGEIPPDKGREMLDYVHGFKESTSLLDDYFYYEKQENKFVSILSQLQK